MQRKTVHARTLSLIVVSVFRAEELPHADAEARQRTAPSFLPYPDAWNAGRVVGLLLPR